MERETLAALSAGVGVVVTLFVEWMMLRMMAWWDRRQAQDIKS